MIISITLIHHNLFPNYSMSENVFFTLEQTCLCSLVFGYFNWNYFHRILVFWLSSDWCRNSNVNVWNFVVAFQLISKIDAAWALDETDCLKFVKKLPQLFPECSFSNFQMCKKMYFIKNACFSHLKIFVFFLSLNVNEISMIE